MRRNICACYILVMFATVSAACLLLSTQSSAADAERWQWEVTPYYWPADVSGNASVNGTTLPVDVDFADISDDIETGILLHIRTTKPTSHLGYNFDALYLNLNGEKTFPEATVSSDLKMTVLELGVTYAPNTEADVLVDQAAGTKKIWWAWLGGIRYFSQSVDLHASTGESGSADISWAEPMIGAIALAPLGGKLSIGLRGDVGGFSVGESDFTWAALIDLRYKLSGKHTLNIGYKWLGVDTGNSENGADITFKGPVFGVSTVF